MKHLRALAELAAQAKAAADRAIADIDDTLAYVEQSDQRIDAMEADAVSRKNRLRDAKGNDSMPPQFVEDTLAALDEARKGKAKPYKFGDKSEP